MSMIQIALLVVGSLIALSAYGTEIISFVSNLFRGQSPEVHPPTPNTPDNPDVIDIDSGFVAVVIGWEKFVNILIKYDMLECAEEMKDLLVKMAEEYRSELNDFTDHTVKQVKKTKVVGGGEAENIDKILEIVKSLQFGEKK